MLPSKGDFVMNHKKGNIFDFFCFCKKKLLNICVSRSHAAEISAGWDLCYGRLVVMSYRLCEGPAGEGQAGLEDS
jgi:hypothetical protein